MAKITLSKLAPQEEEIRFSLGNDSLTLASGGTEDTDDPVLIASALDHPWLDVEFEKVEEPTVAPEDQVQPIAIDSNLNQNTKKVTEGIAQTYAAVEADEEPAKKPARSTATSSPSTSTETTPEDRKS